MAVTRPVVTRDQLAAVARAARGSGHRLAAVARQRGGTKKGVYRLTYDDAATVIAYLWSDAQNYWPATGAGDAAQAGDQADPFSDASGLDLFLAASRHLAALGVRTPRIHLACYALAMHLSLVAGPLRVLDGDFPERDGMRQIAESNLQRALAFLR